MPERRQRGIPQLSASDRLKSKAAVFTCEVTYIFRRPIAQRFEYHQNVSSSFLPAAATSCYSNRTFSRLQSEARNKIGLLNFESRGIVLVTI